MRWARKHHRLIGRIGWAMFAASIVYNIVVVAVRSCR